MTRDRAFEILDKFHRCDACESTDSSFSCNDCDEAFCMALQLLKGEAVVKLMNEREYITKYSGDALQLLPDVMKELVRCKDCKHKEKDGISEGFHYCNVNGLQVTDEWFCADGVPEDGDGE